MENSVEKSKNKILDEKAKTRKNGRTVIMLGAIISIVFLLSIYIVTIVEMAIYNVNSNTFMLVTVITTFVYLFYIIFCIIEIIFVVKTNKNDTRANNMLLGILGIILYDIMLIGGIIVLINLQDNNEDQIHKKNDNNLNHSETNNKINND